MNDKLMALDVPSANVFVEVSLIFKDKAENLYFPNLPLANRKSIGSSNVIDIFLVIVTILPYNHSELTKSVKTLLGFRTIFDCLVAKKLPSFVDSLASNHIRHVQRGNHVQHKANFLLPLLLQSSLTLAVRNDRPSSWRSSAKCGRQFVFRHFVRHLLSKQKSLTIHEQSTTETGNSGA
jgi:hypothetical protein